jgi:hypothetical protein
MGNLKWQKCLGGSEDDFGYAIQPTADGGYILTGFTASIDSNVSGNHGKYDVWIVKLNSSGTLKWQRCLGGSEDDIGNSIQQTNDGGYIVSGQTRSNDGNVRGQHGEDDFWIVKLNKKGNFVWQRCLGGSDKDISYSVKQTLDDGYITVGSTASTNGDVSGKHEGQDFWVVKLNKDGFFQWQQCLGGSGSDIASSVYQSDNGFVVTGYTTSNDGNVSGNHGKEDVWVTRLSKNGKLQLQYCYGGSDHDFSLASQVTTDKGTILGGYTYSNNGDVSGNHSLPNLPDYWALKIDVYGNMQWQKCLGGSNDDVAFLSYSRT